MQDVPTVPYTNLPDLSDPERIAKARSYYLDIASRRSCRMFNDKPVPREVIEQGHVAVIAPRHQHGVNVPRRSCGIAAIADDEGADALRQSGHAIVVRVHAVIVAVVVCIDKGR